MTEITPDLSALIDSLLDERTEARKSRNFARADEIRHAIDAAGIEVQDKEGERSKWVLKPGFDPSKLEGLR